MDASENLRKDKVTWASALADYVDDWGGKKMRTILAHRPCNCWMKTVWHQDQCLLASIDPNTLSLQRG